MASDKAKVKKNALVNYFQASLEELRKVTWPTRNQAVRLTFLVLGFCMVIAVLLGLLDFVFGFGYRSLLDLGPERALPVYEESAPTDAEVPTVDVSDIATEDGAVTIDVGGEGDPATIQPVEITEGASIVDGELVIPDEGTATE